MGSIVDPERIDDYAKYNFVERYFKECVFSLKRVNAISVPARVSRDVSIQVTHSSTLRNVITELMQIENTLSTTFTVPKVTASATVSVLYSITTMKEYVEENSRITNTVEHIDYSDHDRDVVMWDLVKTVALYRQNEVDSISLVGLGDFFVASTVTTYLRSPQ